MLSQAEFSKRYIDRITDIYGYEQDWCEEIAGCAYEMYKQDPHDMTPEEHAEEEIPEWGR